MQTTSDTFNELAHGYVRPLSWGLRASFDKSLDPSITFFTLNSSLLDGPDVLAPDGDSDILPWDQYNYTDYSDRVISIEITQDQQEPYSVVQSFADLTVNNYDNYFTANSGSPIEQYIKPKRPFRILLGFADENLPQFVGLSTTMPELDKHARTAKFHLIDFLTFIFDREIGDTDLLENVSTSEALDYLFQQVGLLSGQYVLDDTSFNRIPYFYVEKGQKLGSVVKELMEAEQGRLYMDELGIIRFQSRQSYNTNSVYNFNSQSIVDYTISDQDEVINFVRIESDVLDKFEDTSLWASASPVFIASGDTVVIWADLPDIQSDVVNPTYSAVEVETSYFITTLEETGETAYTGVSLSSISKFAKAVKMTFSNGGGNNAYITKIDLWGDAIRAGEPIIVQDFDQTSIDDFDERRYELTTKYIQDATNAVSKAAIMIDDYKDFGSILEIEVKGSMALQIGDVVTLDIDGNAGDFTITKVVQVLSNSKYTQRLTVKNRRFRTYFILSSDSEARSLMDGSDVLSP